MPVLIIGDPETGKSQRVELEDGRMAPLIGRRIGETIDGTIAGLAGHKILLTGGTDKDGIPMRPDVHGGTKARIVLSGGVGFKPKNKGERKRVVVRGNTVTQETTFLNFKIVEKPKGSKQKEAEKPDTEEKDEG
ncbi:MAG TPA: 30S ribosomal protein S6e [Patescibacteria group bacterium]|nr:30S ribosomal protein S6e [Patescibacteria group bacterium]